MNEETTEKVNLYIYGSLRDPNIFQSVCGLGFNINPKKVNKKMLLAEPALLPGYKRVSPDNVYFYAVKNRASRIEGLVIHQVPRNAMAEIHSYEGKRYHQETVKVNTATGLVEAQAFLASRETMEKHFGDRFHVNLIHELWLRKRIEKFLERHTRPGEQTQDAEIERRADRELLATTERDLVMSHYHTDAVSDYYLEHELDRPRPSIKHLYDEPKARPFIKNYLTLVVKQILLNQLEERIQSKYRFELEHMRTSPRYFKRSVSLLIALQMINNSSTAVDLIIDQCHQTMPWQKNDLIDYIKYAVQASNSLFDPRIARAHLRRIRSNFLPGLMPLGAEIELSNLGYRAIPPDRDDSKVIDSIYDGFRYFYDFQLDVFAWKLGGYIDDHTGSTDRERRCGFLELAPGRLNIAGELSRPVTADPWLLNQLITAIINFYRVQPHSLHLSFQLRRKQIDCQNDLPLGFVKCLLVLGGGPEMKHTGRLWVSRMGYDEITQRRFGEELIFARTSKRKWYLGDTEIADRAPVQATTHIQQYKFIRLEARANYEPLIMCLKGLQLEYNPADYLSADQLRTSKKHRDQYELLKEWAAEPTEISPQAISRFIKTVQAGLMNERHHKPVHKLHYIDWVLSAIDVQLRMFNKQLRKSLNQ